MRIFLIVFTLSICLSRTSFGVDPFGSAPKEATAHFLSLIFSVAMHTMWPGDNPFEGVAARSEDDPPAPSPSPSVVARLGDGSNPLWLIPPTKSPSASPRPSVSPISQPPVESVGHGDTMDMAEDVLSEAFLDQDVFDISRLLEFLGDALGAQAAELILAMAESEDAPHNAILDGINQVLLTGNAAAQAQAIDILSALTQSEHVPSGVKESAVVAIFESGYFEPSVQAVVPEPLEEQGEYCGEVDEPSLAVVYPVINSTEVPINSVFAQWVSVQLSRVSNGLTPEVRAGLLRLARSRSAPWVERVAAAGFVHLSDEGECKAQAATILSDLAPLVCLHRQAIAEHVRRVLWDHDALAEDLIVELESVVAQSNAWIPSDDAAHRYNLMRLRKQAERLGRKSGAQAAIDRMLLGSDETLRAWYRNRHAFATDVEVDAYVNNYKTAYEKAKDDAARTENVMLLREQAECLGRKNGAQAAIKRMLLGSDETLRAWYRNRHAFATDVEVDAYVNNYKTAYEKAKGTRVQQAERFAKYNGSRAAKRQWNLPSDISLMKQYRNKHPHATDAELNAYVNVYKTAYEKTKMERENPEGTVWVYELPSVAQPLTAAQPAIEVNTERNNASQRSLSFVQSVSMQDNDDLIMYEGNPSDGGRGSGSHLERTRKRKVDSVAKDPVSNKEQRVEEGDVCVVSDKLQSIDSSLIEQAKSSGKDNGSRAAKQGLRLPSHVELIARYRWIHSQAMDAEVEAFATAYSTAYEHAKEMLERARAERLGMSDGSRAAKRGLPLPLDEKLKAGYKKIYAQAADAEAEAEAYVKAYKIGYENAKKPEENAKRLGAWHGSCAGRGELDYCSNEDLQVWYRRKHPDATDAEVNFYVSAYKTAYVETKRKRENSAGSLTWWMYSYSPMEQTETTSQPAIENRTERMKASQKPLSFVQTVSMLLSRGGHPLTAQARVALLTLARSESAPLAERVAAAGFVHLKDEGEFKAEAATILSDLGPLARLHVHAIVAYVRVVLRGHHVLAEELVLELKNVLLHS